MSDIHDLAGAYAIDALPDGERIHYENHLAGCDACSVEVRRLLEVAGRLAMVGSEVPPEAMQASVMERVAATPQEIMPAPTPPQSRKSGIPRRRWLLGVSVAATSLAIVLVVIGTQLAEARRINQILAAPDLITTEQSDGIRSRFSYSPDLSDGVFIAYDLDGLEAGRTYQLWLIDETGAESAGVFHADADGSALVLVEGMLQPGVTLGLTDEPAGGSEQPTTDPLVLLPLG